MTDTLQSLLSVLGIEKAPENLISLDDSGHSYIKDLKINTSNALKFTNISLKETSLLAFAVAVNEKHHVLINSFQEFAIKNGASELELSEIKAIVSLMNINNVFYRFRHFTQKPYYEQTPAGIKMSIMLNPILGKEFFELVSLSISAINGCELCVKSHEESVLKHGSSEARVYDAIRLAAILKGYMVFGE